MAPTDKQASTSSISASNDNTKNGAASTDAAADEAHKTLPQLGALEEDDEFEEFEAEDWDDSEASLSQLNTNIKGKSDPLNANTTTAGKAGTTTDNLWEDNWDDDDIEDDFSVQLRKAISEHNSNGPAPMTT